MDLQLALHLLEINIHEYSTLTETILKKKYHKQALANHPDKNGNTIQSNEKFQKIQEAYEVVKREISILNAENEIMEDENISSSSDYSNIVYLFIHELLKGKYTELFCESLRDIIVGCKKISFHLFEHIDKELCLDIYVFLSKYQKIFFISEETLMIVKNIIIEKCKDDEIFIIRPTLQDLFENNVFKLNINETIYFVPLWHSECYFDGEKGDIIVKCVPELPNNIEIDEDNNILVNITIPFTFSLFSENPIKIYLDENVVIPLPLQELRLQPFQLYVCKQKGISKIKDNIHDIECKSDIILRITFIED